MSKTKTSIIFFLILCLFGGVIYFVWHNRIQTNKLETTQESEARNDFQPSNLSVSKTTNPLDLGQIPLDGIDGAKKGSNNNSAQTKGLDPKSFAQYEKYKSSNSGMFGELVIGDGAEVALNKKVAIVYRVWLTDGTLVDISKKDKDNRTIPTEFEFGQNQIIPGLQQGMLGMKNGGTRLIIVPPSVGYGDQKHEIIPANSVLVFEVSVIKVED